VRDDLAMAIHGLPRATIDVDLVVAPSAAEHVLVRARALGYTIAPGPTSFAGGEIEIRSVTKIDPTSGDLLSLDRLLVDSEATRLPD
jgi:hypothetical protein